MRTIVLFILLFGAITYTQRVYGQDELIEQLESALNSKGYTVLQTETVGVMSHGFKLNHQFYPGNQYILVFNPIIEESPAVKLSLSMKTDENKLIRSSLDGEILLNLTTIKRPFDGVVELSLLNPEGDYNIGILFIAYKSGKNLGEKPQPNLPENYYYSLKGMEFLSEAKKLHEEQARSDAKKHVEQDGFSISLEKTLSLSGENDSVSYTFLEGNEYFIYAYSNDALAATIEVFRENILSSLSSSFEGLLGQQPNKQEKFKIIKGENNNLILDFRKDGFMSSTAGIKISNSASLPADQIYLVVGFKSKSNDTNNASNNSAENFYYEKNKDSYDLYGF